MFLSQLPLFCESLSIYLSQFSSRMNFWHGRSQDACQYSSTWLLFFSQYYPVESTCLFLVQSLHFYLSILPLYTCSLLVPDKHKTGCFPRNRALTSCFPIRFHMWDDAAEVVGPQMGFVSNQVCCWSNMGFLWETEISRHQMNVFARREKKMSHWKRIHLKSFVSLSSP